MARPIYFTNTGPDCYHWQHHVTMHRTLASAMSVYDAAPGNHSAVIIRMHNNIRKVINQNRFNHGHAIEWCQRANVPNACPEMAV